MDKQHIDERYELYCKMLDELDKGCRLIIDYDSVPFLILFLASYYKGEVGVKSIKQCPYFCLFCIMHLVIRVEICYSYSVVA